MINQIKAFANIGLFKFFPDSTAAPNGLQNRKMNATDFPSI